MKLLRNLAVVRGHARFRRGLHARVSSFAGCSSPTHRALFSRSQCFVASALLSAATMTLAQRDGDDEQENDSFILSK